ncbi:MAG: thioredoxin family protein [Phycisphaerales bacterium]|nr:thioredoxin family protein [Phycisphaerales bacterium]
MCRFNVGQLAAAAVMMACACVSRAQDKAPAPPAQPAAQPQVPAPPTRTNLNRPAPKVQRQTPVRPFNADTDVRAAIEAAVTRAAGDNKRVLVIWGDNASVWAPKMLEYVQRPTIRTALLYYYEVVWADIADPTIGPINMALCQSYGADPAPETGKKAMPYFTVIDSLGEKAGKQVLARSSKGMEDTRKLAAGQYDFNQLLLEDFLLEQKREPLVAQRVLDDARSKAKERGLPLLLIFDEVADGWCVRLRAWLAKPEVRPIFDRHFVVTRIDVNRMTDGFKLMDVFAGDKAEVSPWYLFCDAQDKRLAPVVGSEDDNLGFPTGEEIPRFVAMLRRVAPKMTDDEATAIEASLRAETEPKPVGKP